MKKFDEVMTNTEMELPPYMNIREILGLNKALQQINGQAKLAAVKISALEDGIVKLEDKLESEDLTPEEREDIRAKIKELEVQRNEQRDHLRVDIESKLRSQINRIRETFYQMRYVDEGFVEKIKTLFREQAVTIGTILFALGELIGMIIEGVVLSGKKKKLLLQKQSHQGQNLNQGLHLLQNQKHLRNGLKHSLRR